MRERGGGEVQHTTELDGKLFSLLLAEEVWYAPQPANSSLLTYLGLSCEYLVYGGVLSS